MYCVYTEFLLCRTFEWPCGFLGKFCRFEIENKFKEHLAYSKLKTESSELYCQYTDSSGENPFKTLELVKLVWNIEQLHYF